MTDHDSDDVVEEFARQLEQAKVDNDSDGSISGDEGDEIPFGYEQLPQDEDEGVSLSDETEETSSLPMEHFEAPSLALPPAEEISEDTANTIRTIMSTIQLSDRGIPEWARNIPESMWLPKLNSSDSSTTKD
ncbi:hypothetical protein BX666DRAFT_709784 [Dichotomocladium elegans]|nr:hypothetical protein BX666DRAFT_709784 [Dichotomocladium elegans]